LGRPGPHRTRHDGGSGAGADRALTYFAPLVAKKLKEQA